MAKTHRFEPAAVASQLRRRWNGKHRAWLDGGGNWPLQILLGAPTEREATQDLAGMSGWIHAWQQGRFPGELIWTERQWPGLGRQRLPERVSIPNPASVADWIGEQTRWLGAEARATRLRAELQRPELSLGRHFDWLADAADTEFERLLSVLRWIRTHPDSGLYVRQLPIPGVDTKWLAANRTRVCDLLRKVTGQDGDLHHLAGLRREPDLLRLRILDPALRAVVGGLSDLSAPVHDIAALPLQPERILIVENLQTGLAMTDLPGTLCFMARGYAVEVFTEITWLEGCRCHYWGDLDTHGFGILNRLRHQLPQAQSLLMDADTLLAHQALWQAEDKPVTGTLDRLTGAEQAVFEGLLANRWGHHVRLEQERIDWLYAWRRIRALGDRFRMEPKRRSTAN